MSEHSSCVFQRRMNTLILIAVVPSGSSVYSEMVIVSTFFKHELNSVLF